MTTDREPTNDNKPDGLKVYELAKEFGIAPLDLVEKLKTLEINVKNHMSELTDSDAEKARSVLKAGSVSSKKAAADSAVKTKPATPKKVVARRASPGGDSVAVSAIPVVPAAATTPPPAKPKAAVKKKTLTTSTAAATPTVAAPAAAADASSSSSTVIRRRLLSDGATQTVTSTVSTETTKEAIKEEVKVDLKEETKTDVGHDLAAEKLPEPTTDSSDGKVETVRREVKTEGGKTTTSVIRRTETTLVTSSAKDGLKKVGGLRIIEQAKPAPKVMNRPTPSPGIKKGGVMDPNSILDPTKLGAKSADRDGFKFGRIDKDGRGRSKKTRSKSV